MSDSDLDKEFWYGDQEELEAVRSSSQVQQSCASAQGKVPHKQPSKTSARGQLCEAQPLAPIDVVGWKTEDCDGRDFDEDFDLVQPLPSKIPARAKGQERAEKRTRVQAQAQRGNVIRQYISDFIADGRERLHFTRIPGVDGSLNDLDCDAVHKLCNVYFGSHGLQLYESSLEGQGRGFTLFVPPSSSRAAAAAAAATAAAAAAAASAASKSVSSRDGGGDDGRGSSSSSHSSSSFNTSASASTSTSTGHSGRRSCEAAVALELATLNVTCYRNKHEIGFFKDVGGSSSSSLDDTATSVDLPNLIKVKSVTAVVILTCWLSPSWIDGECSHLLAQSVDAVLVHGAGKPSSIVSDWFRKKAGKKVAVRPTDRHNKMAKPGTKGPMHHAKGFIIFSPTAVRVIITSANLSHGDTLGMANGWWFQDFPLKTGPRSEACSVPSAVLKPEFEYALTMYLAHVLHPDNVQSADERVLLGSLGSCKKGLVHELSRYDFSGARARLVMSIPFHAGTGAAMLSRLMPPREETAHLPVVMQASSIGSQGPGRNYVTSYLADAMGQPDDSSERGLVNILWPSVGFYGDCQNVGTMFIPFRKEEWIATSRYFSRYEAAPEYQSRLKQTPHIKSYCAYDPHDARTLKWCILTSANMSQAAWGMLRGGVIGPPIHYELGVYFGPGLPATDGMRLVTHAPRDGEIVLPLGYRLPAPRYGPQDTPWGMDAASCLECKHFKRSHEAKARKLAQAASGGPSLPKRPKAQLIDDPVDDFENPSCAFESAAEAIAAATDAAQAGPGARRRREESEAKAADALLTLSREQLAAVELARSGQSFFFTGSAGTGKSTTLRVIVAALTDGKRDVAVTASTGAAAMLIGGKTLHSWSGCKLAAGPWEALRGELTPASEQRWRDTDCLIIDEISMVEPELFTKFEALSRAVRGSTEPFGGIQVIACGDFLQLPPVRPGKTADAPGRFAFDTAAWKKTFRANVLLTEGHRQHEPELLELLRSVRRGELTPQAQDTIRACATHALDFAPGIVATVLYATNRAVDRINARELAALPEPQFDCKAVDKGDEMLLGVIKHGLPDNVSLRVGAQVRYTINTPKDGLVNGSRGVVLELPRKPGAPVVVRFVGKDVPSEVSPQVLDVPGDLAEEEPLAERSQYPLRLAWAATIHRSQGCTLDLVDVDLDGCFELGQAYTALSRCRTLLGLRITNFSPDLLKTSKAARDFDDELRRHASIN